MGRQIKISKDGQRLAVELCLRVILFAGFLWTDDLEPFHRTLQPEELWFYRFPQTPSYCPVRILWISMVIATCVIVGGFYILQRDLEDMVQSLLGVFLVCGLCGVLTNCIKLAVGRPRPDFLQRCFGQQEMISFKAILNTVSDCNGKPAEVIQGLKSFPSGHSSHAMTCFGYLGLYVAGKFRIFSSKGQSSGWHLLLVAALFLWPVLIAVSRTADYHHHWQDVSVGLILGFFVAYFTYYQHYPPLTHLFSHLPYSTHGQRDNFIDLEKGSFNSELPAMKII